MFGQSNSRPSADYELWPRNRFLPETLGRGQAFATMDTWSQILVNLKPIGSMYGIFTYIYHKNQPNLGKNTSPMDPMVSHVDLKCRGF